MVAAGRRVAIVGLISASAIGMAGPAAAIGDFVAGGWAGEAIFKDASFAHCAMRSKHGPWTLAFSLDRNGGAALALAHGQLKYTKGKTIRGSLQIDDAPATTRSFNAVRANLIGIGLGRATALQPFANARRLRVRIGEVSAELSLSRSADAFQALSACVARHTRPTR
jgi:hypothetical protein